MSKIRHLGVLLVLLHGLLPATAAVYGEGQQRLTKDGSSLLPDPFNPSTSRRQLSGRFLHITDFHPDELYLPHSSDDKDDACHRGHGPAGFYGTEMSPCDSPISLVNATFDWIAANLRDVDFVVWTGDSARHDNDDETPRTAVEVIRTNQLLADKMVEVFSDGLGPDRMTVPVVPNIGNNDFLPHNILLPGPNKWLDTYSEVWRPFIPPHQRREFEFGGWFSVEVIPNRLAVLSLNTMYFFDKNAGVKDCSAPSQPGFKQMEWLRVQLQLLRERGLKAVLIGHVPPAKTDSKQPWDETCYRKYNLWLRQYRDVVIGSLYGHMNMDHFVLHDTKEIDMDLLGHGEKSYNHEREVDIETDDDDDEEKDLLEDEPEPWERVTSTELKKRGGDAPKLSGKSRYLLELRDFWSNLPAVTPLCKGVAPESEDDGSSSSESKKDKKRRKKEKKRRKKALKKLGGKWAERFHVSLISPSVVPNFFPTLRVIEYNITGLEDVPTWEPMVPDPADPEELSDGVGDFHIAELEGEIRHAKGVKKAAKKQRKADKKAKSKRKGKKGGDNESNVIVPEPPSNTTPPGPAYSPQPLTWTGYTQYFANLTRINNPSPSDGGNEGEPGEFSYEVEYSTFKDKVLKLADLTVRNYVRLAYRMGMAEADRRDDDDDDDNGDSNSAQEEEEEGGEEEEEEEEDDEEWGEAAMDEVYQDVECEAFTDMGKKRRERRKRASERAWAHFLNYAFVSTGYERENMERVTFRGDQ